MFVEIETNIKKKAQNIQLRPYNYITEPAKAFIFRLLIIFVLLICNKYQKEMKHSNIFLMDQLNLVEKKQAKSNIDKRKKKAKC